MHLTGVQAIVTILAIAVGTQLTRWLPFWLFPEKRIPRRWCCIWDMYCPRP